jgi:glutamyl-tRNA(Gln) amidotransferase subunit D
MYSREIERILTKKGLKAGDRVKISAGKHSHEGILMPRIGLGDSSNIVIKLDNGYNFGVKHEKGVRIELVKRGKMVKAKSANVKFEKRSDMPSVSVLGCGGTIASRVEYSTGAVYPAFSPDDLIMSFPELRDIADVDGRKVFNIFSEDMTTEHWKTIAREVVKEIKTKVDGVVLTHGTDTMHYTAPALSFMLKDLPVPVVMVGAQRSSDRGSSDNLMNFVCSVLAATRLDVAEVTACMHGNVSDDFCYLLQGTKFRKMHTSRRDAFRSVNVLPFAKIWYTQRKFEVLRDDYAKRSSKTPKLDDKLNPDVGLIYIHPGIKPEFIKALGKHHDGIVIAGTGLGHVPTNPGKDKFSKSLVPSLKGLIDSGVPVVMAPQTIFGRIDMNVYTAGRLLNEIGVIGDGADWTPETAMVKLMYVLGHTKNMRKVGEMMMTNVAGEISDRTEREGYLV